MVIVPILLIVWVIVGIPAHIVLTYIVFQDARNLNSPALNISPVLWTAISFVLPFIGMLIYWVMNHSNLNLGSSK